MKKQNIRLARNVKRMLFIQKAPLRLPMPPLHLLVKKKQSSFVNFATIAKEPQQQFQWFLLHPTLRHRPAIRAVVMVEVTQEVEVPAAAGNSFLMSTKFQFILSYGLTDKCSTY